MLEMEKDFDSKLKIQGNSSSSNGGGGGNVQRSKSFAFRAPQENYTIQDFELGKIYGVGSYSKVLTHNPVCLCLCFLFFCCCGSVFCFLFYVMLWWMHES